MKKKEHKSTHKHFKSVDFYNIYKPKGMFEELLNAKTNDEINDISKAFLELYSDYSLISIIHFNFVEDVEKELIKCTTDSERENVLIHRIFTKLIVLTKDNYSLLSNHAFFSFLENKVFFKNCNAYNFGVTMLVIGYISILNDIDSLFLRYRIDIEQAQEVANLRILFKRNWSILKKEYITNDLLNYVISNAAQMEKPTQNLLPKEYASEPTATSQIKELFNDLSEYINGGDYEKFKHIIEHKTPYNSTKLNWIGKQVEAFTFIKHFNLSVAQFNKCFSLSKGGELKTSNKGDKSYPIDDILRRYQ